MPKVTHIAKESHEPEEREDGQHTIRETWKIRTDEWVKWSWLRQQRGVPKRRDENTFEAGFYLKDIRPKRMTPLLWELELDYSIIQPLEWPESPIARPARIVSVESQIIEEDTIRDRKGFLITSTAGEIMTGLKRRRALLVYTVVKNLAKDPDWLDTHIAAINVDAVTLRGRTRKPHSLMLESVQLGEYQKEKTFTFTPVTMKLIYDPLLWLNEILNQGTVELVRTQRQIIDKDGEVVRVVPAWRQQPIKVGTPAAQVTEPVPLTKAGKAITGHLDPAKDRVVDQESLWFFKPEIQEILPFAVLPLK